MKTNKLLLILTTLFMSLSGCSFNSPKYTEIDVVNAFINEAELRIKNHGKVGIEKTLFLLLH